MNFRHKDFLSLMDFSTEEIMFALSTADTMKYILNQKNKKAPHLQGKTVIVIFYEENTRTMLSYELAAGYLSANVVNMSVYRDGDIAENLVDFGRVVDQMGGDFIILRHPMSGSARLLANHTNACVINAGDGINENPAQSLLDLFTIKTQKNRFEGLKVTIVGDIINSRVSKSNMWGLLKLGALVRVAAPPTLLPPGLESLGVKVFFDPREAVNGADVIIASRLLPEESYANVLPSFSEYRNLFIINDTMLRYASKDVIILHPGPIKRGIEISQSVIDSRRCIVDNQIANGVAIRMAILYLLSLKGGKSFEAVD